MPTPSSIDENDHTTKVQGLFIQHQPEIRGFVLAMIPNFSLADDVMQETFLIVTKKAASFEIGTSFAAWVKTIARYKALEAIRARKFDTLSEEVLEALGSEPHEFAGDTDERLVLLRGCLDQLAPQARRSIDYRYQNENLPPQIASLMGCTVQSVNVTLSRARTFLRECVQRRMASNPNLSHV
ncbi:sigma-70 family RNA polymerase sigma factor [Luteolibacter yonseiensis]|uniref:Sigma-70 family RNA polymerase sigma factor n=1 Tax=Luteolibacter yonseiensis TaxID=1144680 RepID=A0A934R4X5_9BACT|nr:sigma-70 family RNA polymerase sigma factor [Luteolibacter yonseiensis]MBK1817017.1 sigma-70 family RNA polymerase sigma factor [Luteolibacter yonseiensis]